MRNIAISSVQWENYYIASSESPSWLSKRRIWPIMSLTIICLMLSMLIALPFQIDFIILFSVHS